MPDKRNVSEYLEKAAKYELLAQFYKYTNPNLHIHYYLKHLNNMNKAIQQMSHYPDFLKDDSEANIRILHASPDTPKIDIYINNRAILNDIPYKRVTENIPLQQGKHLIELYPAGNKVNPLLSKQITVELGKSYTLTIIGKIKNLKLISYLNQPEVPTGEAKIRFVHLSPDSAPLDFAVKDRDIVFPDISYKKATEYLALTPMTVDLEVREAGTKNIILPMPKSQFLKNTTYTIALVGYSKVNPKIEALFITD